jgi:uncharacterized sporulation protein YeaH/YhbH (DUF444 family)
VDLLKTELLPKSNLFCYGQVRSLYGSGNFIRDMKAHFEQEENMAISEIAQRDDIFDAIKVFLGKGK